MVTVVHKIYFSIPGCKQQCRSCKQFISQQLSFP